MSGLVLAHEPVVAGRPVAAGLFLLALEAGIAGRTGAEGRVGLVLVGAARAEGAVLGSADGQSSGRAVEAARDVVGGQVQQRRQNGASGRDGQVKGPASIRTNCKVAAGGRPA